LKNFRKAIDININDVDAWNYYGITYMDQGKYKKSIEIFKKGIKENFDSGSLFYSMGIAYGKLGNNEKELELYSEAVKRLPDDYQIWSNMGCAYEDLGHPNKAARAWKIADQIQDGFHIKNEKEVIELLEIIKYGGLDPVYKGKAANKAIKEGQQSSSLNEKLKLYKEAYNLYKEINNNLGIANASNHIAGVYKEKREWLKSIAKEEEAVRIHKKLNFDKFVGRELHNIGYCYYQLEDYEIAIRNFEESVEIHKKLNDRRRWGDSVYNLGLIYKKMGDYDKSIEYFEKNLKNDIEDQLEVNQALDLKELGDVYNEKGEKKRALEFLKEFKSALKKQEAKLNKFGNLPKFYFIVNKMDEGPDESAPFIAEMANRISEILPETSLVNIMQVIYPTSIKIGTSITTFFGRVLEEIIPFRRYINEGLSTLSLIYNFDFSCLIDLEVGRLPLGWQHNNKLEPKKIINQLLDLFEEGLFEYSTFTVDTGKQIKEVNISRLKILKREYVYLYILGDEANIDQLLMKKEKIEELAIRALT
ncbi:hypothetical protein LCGC14_2412760, partial [marine sediment metagenome]